MDHLGEALATRTQQWREQGHPCEEFPAIGEILDYQTHLETGGLRYLRAPQLRALEVHGLNHDAITDYVLDEGLDALWDRLPTAREFVRGRNVRGLLE